jgi:homocysteine S-methyltransferase
MFLNPSSTSYSPSDLEKAHSTMVKALQVITEETLPAPKRLERPVAALSLGPFGAQLQPGQEYAGLYPVPYGRKETPSKLGFPKLAAEAHPLQLEWIGETAVSGCRSSS